MPFLRMILSSIVKDYVIKGHSKIHNYLRFQVREILCFKNCIVSIFI